MKNVAENFFEGIIYIKKRKEKTPSFLNLPNPLDTTLFPIAKKRNILK